MIFFDAARIVPWVCERTRWPVHPERVRAIGKTDRDGNLIAGVLYEDFNGANVACHIAGDGKRWADRDFLWVIFHYPFKQLGVKRITVLVYDVNAASRNFVEKLGFELEAILHDAHPRGHTLVYKMTPDKCRWLGVSDESAFRARNS